MDVSTAKALFLPAPNDPRIKDAVVCCLPGVPMTFLAIPLTKKPNSLNETRAFVGHPDKLAWIELLPVRPHVRQFFKHLYVDEEALLKSGVEVNESVRLFYRYGNTFDILGNAILFTDE